MGLGQCEYLCRLSLVFRLGEIGWDPHISFMVVKPHLPMRPRTIHTSTSTSSLHIRESSAKLILTLPAVGRITSTNIHHLPVLGQSGTSDLYKASSGSFPHGSGGKHKPCSKNIQDCPEKGREGLLSHARALILILSPHANKWVGEARENKALFQWKSLHETWGHERNSSPDNLFCKQERLNPLLGVF